MIYNFSTMLLENKAFLVVISELFAYFASIYENIIRLVNQLLKEIFLE